MGSALLAWLTPELVTDRDRARRAIAVLTATARDLDCRPWPTAARAGNDPGAGEGRPAPCAGFKQIGRVYGLDADASLSPGRGPAGRRPRATWPRWRSAIRLLGKPVQFQMQLLRRDGRWYSADAVRHAEAELARPLADLGFGPGRAMTEQPQLPLPRPTAAPAGAGPPARAHGRGRGRRGGCA